MKRVWIAIILLGLLLTGCAWREEPEDTEPVPETTAPGLYQPQSTVEQQTEGAVRRYDLPGEDYCWISIVGDQLLLASSTESVTELMLLGGAEGRTVATAQIPMDLSAEDVSWRATHSGFAYYNSQLGDVVFLDSQLQERDRIPLPQEMIGQPLISEDGSVIFYCTVDEIRVLETEYKITRRIKSHNCTDQKLIDTYFDGSLVGCYIRDGNGNANQYYLSSENGLTVASDIKMTALYTYGETYLALRQEGETQQVILGSREGTHLTLAVESQIAPALELGGVVSYHAADNILDLTFYQLDGTEAGKVAVTDIAQPQMLVADRWSHSVWVLTRDLTTNANILLRWDLS